MRLFCGIDLPEDIRERLERLLMHLRPAAHLKWSTVYNLHITPKFIGEWPEGKLPQTESALRSLARPDRFTASFRSVASNGHDAFPRGGARISGGWHSVWLSAGQNEDGRRCSRER